MAVSHPKTGFIVFSGYNQRAVVALCRTLACNDIPFSIIASSAHDAILLSEYRSCVSAVRGHKSLEPEDLRACLQATREKGECTHYVLAPSAESLNIFLLEHRSLVEDLGCTIPLVPLDLYRHVSDKESFTRCCRDYGVPVPETIPMPVQFGLPFVAKPVRNVTPQGVTLFPYIIRNAAEYETFTKGCNVDDYFIQEYIQGESYYLLYYVTRSGDQYKYSQKNLVQQARGKSIVMAEPAEVHLDPRYRVYDRILADLSFHGLIMIEIRVRDSAGYMIEANPRMWGPSQLMVDGGMNLLACLVNDYSSWECPLDNLRRVSDPGLYCWTAGFLQSLSTDGYVVCLAEQASVAEWLWRFLPNDVYFRGDTMGIFDEEMSSVLVRP
jgi:predicted ATP-grasp superfamily ATP-dependent carboligase